MKTRCIFRVFKDTGDLVALFPNEIADNSGNCMSYMKIGQHGAADYNGVMKITKRCRASEYQDLKKELESIGYNLDVKMRR